MGQPKKRTTHRRTGNRRSHEVVKLARQVNKKSPVKAFTTKKEVGDLLGKPKSAAKKVVGKARAAVKRSSSSQAPIKKASPSKPKKPTNKKS